MEKQVNCQSRTCWQLGLRYVSVNKHNRILRERAAEELESVAGGLDHASEERIAMVLRAIAAGLRKAGGE